MNLIIYISFADVTKNWKLFLFVF